MFSKYIINLVCAKCGQAASLESELVDGGYVVLTGNQSLLLLAIGTI